LALFKRLLINILIFSILSKLIINIDIYKNRSIFANIKANNKLLREEGKVKYTKGRVIKAANGIMFRVIIIIGALLRCFISSLLPRSVYSTCFSTCC
jgi:hypothetical protein